MATKVRFKVEKQAKKPVDFCIVIVTVILVMFGIMMVTSSSYYSSINESGTPYGYLVRELVWVASGALLMWAGSAIDYRLFNRLAPGIMAMGLLLLVLVLTPLGVERNNAQRWIGVGDFTIMPGEIAKICVIIFVAWFLSRNEWAIHRFFSGILPLLVLAGACFALIMMQPNMSTAIIICALILGMMFIGGLKWRYLLLLAGTGAAAGTYFVLSDESGYRMERIVSFLDPFADPLGTGYQVVQSLMALGSGGLFGLGLGKSIQKNLYLPEPQNDFILAIIGEELGFLGILFVAICYLVLIYRGIHAAVNAPDKFGMLLASGITMMLAFQVLMNIAVVTSSMPPTGVTLPFISYGGNAMWLFMGSMGILLNISRRNPEDENT